MAILSDYTAGTVSVSAAGTAVTGVGTLWQVAGLQEGDWFIANGWVNVVASVNSDTSLTLVQPWRGGALTGAVYRLRYMSDGSRASAQARQLIDMLGGSGNLEALGGLVGTSGAAPYFTGAGTMGTFPTTAFGRAVAGLSPSPGSFVATTAANGAAVRSIVGTVVQSGGVTNGSIIEQGGNANGSYTRFADGTQICRAVRDLTGFNMTQVVDSIFYNPVSSTNWVFPATFGSPDVTFGGAFVRNERGMTGLTVLQVTSSQVTYLPVASRPYPAAADKYAHVFAIGRWL